MNYSWLRVAKFWLRVASFWATYRQFLAMGSQRLFLYVPIYCKTRRHVLAGVANNWLPVVKISLWVASFWLPIANTAYIIH
jgi:hypothetical protein